MLVSLIFAALLSYRSLCEARTAIRRLVQGFRRFPDRSPAHGAWVADVFHHGAVRLYLHGYQGRHSSLEPLCMGFITCQSGPDHTFWLPALAAVAARHWVCSRYIPDKLQLQFVVFHNVVGVDFLWLFNPYKRTSHTLLFELLCRVDYWRKPYGNFRFVGGALLFQQAGPHPQIPIWAC